jgi:hypothetical protein
MNRRLLLQGALSLPAVYFANKAITFKEHGEILKAKLYRVYYPSDDETFYKLAYEQTISPIVTPDRHLQFSIEVNPKRKAIEIDRIEIERNGRLIFVQPIDRIYLLPLDSLTVNIKTEDITRYV